MSRQRKPQVFIDFDGTISPCHWPKPLVEPPHPDCKRSIDRWIEQGFEIVLWTCRANKELFGDTNDDVLNEAIDYLKKHEIKFHHIVTTKPDYHALIDDRAGFNGDWSQFND